MSFSQIQEIMCHVDSPPVSYYSCPRHKPSCCVSSYHPQHDDLSKKSSTAARTTTTLQQPNAPPHTNPWSPNIHPTLVRSSPQRYTPWSFVPTSQLSSPRTRHRPPPLPPTNKTLSPAPQEIMVQQRGHHAAIQNHGRSSTQLHLLAVYTRMEERRGPIRSSSVPTRGELLVTTIIFS